MLAFWVKLPLRIRQLLAMTTIATSGLASGGLIAAQTGSPILPAPMAIVHSPVSYFPTPPTLAEIIPLSPSPSPKPKAKASPKPKSSPAPAKVAAKRSFTWGATVLPFPFKEKNELFLPEQFRLAQELGLRAVRVEYSVQNAAANQLAIEQAKKYNLTLVFIIPFGPNDIFSDTDLYKNAHRYVSDIIGQYKGQVPVWQLATEVASVAIVDGNHHGVDRVDYPEAKYQAVATWLKAATTAVKESDPGAKRLINDQWVHVGFFDRFLAEGGDFDILGWNWFSDMGTDWNKPILNGKTGQRYELLKKLKSFKKEIWLTEVNRRGGSSGGKEKEQADYIQTMAEKAYADGAITGFFVFNLVEDQTAPGQEQGYGIVHGNTEKQWVAGPKEAYHRYQDLIKAKR